MSEKLYKITNGVGTYWVIAPDPTKAQEKLLKMLNENNYGYNKDRQPKEFVFIAEAPDSPDFITNKHLVL